VVTVRVGSNAMLFPALARGEIDVVVGVLPADAASGPREAEGAAGARACTTRPGIVAGREHPLAQRATLQLAELQDLQWIVPTPESVAYPAVRAFFHEAGLPLPPRRVESVSMLTNLVLLATAPVVALMPRSAVERFARAGLLTLLAIDGPRHVSAVGYTVRAERESTAATERFLAALREAAQRPHAAG
jgi:DNA-binding transcriptional LysR family regulator